MRRIAFYLTVFLFVFGPRFAFLDVHGATVICASIVGIYQIWRKGFLPYEFKALFFSYWPIIFYASVITVIYGAADPTIAWIFLKLVMYLLGGWALVVLARRLFEGNFSNEIFLSIWAAGVVNGLFVIAMIFVPRLRHWVAPLLELGGKEHWVESGYRSFDISMGGGAIASVVFATLLFSGLVGRKQIKNDAFTVLGSYILAVATILTGRTGTILMFFGLGGFGLWLVARTMFGSVRLRSVILVWLYVLFPMASALVLLMLSEGGETYSAIIEVVVPWAFEGLSFSEGGVGAVEANSSFLKLLNSMFFLPSDDSTLIFGSSNAGRSNFLPYLPTDVGYLRILNAVGIIGIALAMFPFWIMAKTAVSKLDSCIESWPILIMLAVLLVVNAKELVIAPRGGAAILSLWFCSIALQSGIVAMFKRIEKDGRLKTGRDI